MSDQPLNDAQVREVRQIAELATRRYFDHYLREVFPQQQKALREHTHLMVEAHDADETAHGGVEHRLARLIWIGVGVGLASGGTGAVLSRLFMGMG